jgi:ferredoxin/flavodoxin---NADP+ reductase
MANWNTATVMEKISWNDNLFSLRIRLDNDQAGDFSYKPGQFVRVALDIEGERIARPYSIVSTPQDDFIEIYFNIVPDGPLSPALAALGPGDMIYVAERASGFLTLDELPASNDLWMLATGTGVGPFISMLKQSDLWQRYQKVVLVYSVKQASDFAYQDVIQNILDLYPEQFVYIPVCTREPLEGTLSRRIPLCLEDGSLEQLAGVDLEHSRSHVMMCGNSSMIASVSECLGERGMKKHLRRDPGHFTTEKYH